MARTLNHNHELSGLGALLITCAILVSSSVAWGAPVPSVVLDGSFGAKGALPGPNFLIPASDGKQVGGNLFQSFSHEQ